jgi:hypothetical protein
MTWTFFGADDGGADDGIRTRDPHLGNVIWHNSATSYFIHSSMSCWAFDLPLLVAMNRYWSRVVRFRGAHSTDFRTTCTTQVRGKVRQPSPGEVMPGYKRSVIRLTEALA